MTGDIGQRVRRRIQLPPEFKANDVGYGKPPRAYQFKPGESGNPKGRKKGVKNEATILRELLQHKVSLTERGRTRKINLLEAILRKVAEDGLKGNIKSTAFLLNRYHAVSTGNDGVQHSLDDDDKAVLEAYLKEFQARPHGERS